MQDKTNPPVQRYKIGTHCFKDMNAVCYYYRHFFEFDDDDEKYGTLYNLANSKVISGEAKIGPPPQPKNESNLVELDVHGRYWISCVWKNQFRTQ